MPELLPYNGTYYLWDYVPSLPAAIVFLGLFATATIWHGALLLKTQQWFCLPFIFGGLCMCTPRPVVSRGILKLTNFKVEIGGYAARCVSHFNTSELLPYVIQSTFILIPPVLFAASIYMILGRIIRQANGEHFAIVPVRWLTVIFVTGDIFAFIVQASGAGLMATDGNTSLGEKIIIGGLGIQIVMFSLFIVTAGIFHLRYHRLSVGAVTGDSAVWKPSLYMLYAVSWLILIRSIFRLIEFIMGRGGYLLRHEWTLYVFDSALMWGVMVLFALWWPRKIQPKKLG